MSTSIFAPIPVLVDELRAGRMVVLVDDEDRENEGDLVMAAQCVQPADINFMARHGRGLVCLSLTEARCRQLGLRLMVSDNRARFATAFTVSIEAASGVTTGISAYDRAHTIRTAVSAEARPEDLAQPGHVFPLRAEPGGVLNRAGHTEASVDLACLAGFEPAGVICEILNEDGTMARRPDLERFAATHGLKMGTIADLIAYRLRTENTIQRVYDDQVMTEVGPFRLVAYRDLLDKSLHFALVAGDVSDGQPVLTRVHVLNPLSDVLLLSQAHGLPALRALEQVQRCGRGIVLVISSGTLTGDALLDRLRSGGDGGFQTPPQQWRRHGIGGQILRDLGAFRLRVMGSRRKYAGLSGFGLEVVDYVDS